MNLTRQGIAFLPVAGILAIGIASLAAVEEHSESNPAIAQHDDRPPQPIAVFTGCHSAIHTPKYILIDNDKDLLSAWSQHVGCKPDDVFSKSLDHFAIDFDHNVVVEIFSGQIWNSRGITVDSLTESLRTDGAGVIQELRFDQISYQTDGAGDRVTPFAFVVVSRKAGSIRLSENVQHIIGGPPQWKQQAEFTVK